MDENGFNRTGHLRTQIDNLWFHQETSLTNDYSLGIVIYGWLPRSFDLTPCDFFLSRYLKFEVYQTKPTHSHDLKNKITTEMEKVSLQTSQNVINNVAFERANVCIQMDAI